MSCSSTIRRCTMPFVVEGRTSHVPGAFSCRIGANESTTRRMAPVTRGESHKGFRSRSRRRLISAGFGTSAAPVGGLDVSRETVQPGSAGGAASSVSVTADNAASTTTLMTVSTSRVRLDGVWRFLLESSAASIRPSSCRGRAIVTASAGARCPPNEYAISSR